MASADLVLIPVVGILAVAVVTLLYRRRTNSDDHATAQASEDLVAARRALSEMRQQTELELASARTLAEAELAEIRERILERLDRIRERDGGEKIETKSAAGRLEVTRIAIASRKD